MPALIWHHNTGNDEQNGQPQGVAPTTNKTGNHRGLPQRRTKRATTGGCPNGGGRMFDPKIHHRRSIRLQGYDYSQAGMYFITLCTQKRECLLGEIVDGHIQLNDAGRMVQTVWDEIPSHYSGADIDVFIAMPNHIHGIIAIVGAGPRACPDSVERQIIRATTNKRATTGGCPYGVVIIGCGASVQNHDHETICRRCETKGSAAIFCKVMATQLLGTHHS